MRTSVRLRRCLALAATTGAAVLVAACGAPQGAHDGHGTMPGMSSPEMAGHGQAQPAGTGLSATERGYTLSEPRLAADGTLTLRILAPSGRPQTAFAVEQTKRLHLYLVRQDLAVYQHLHPQMAADGTWTTRARVDSGGPYRVFTEFTAESPEGQAHLTLSRPVTVPGAYAAKPLPAPATSANMPGGYTITWSGTAKAGQHAMLSARITRAGQPVTDLEPYLDSYAHLTAFRSGDLAVTHLHPGQPVTPGQKGGPELSFGATFPGTGDYALFLQFQTAGQLHVAPVTLRVG